MPFSKKEAPNCDWCVFKKNCFFSLLEEKSSQKHWKDMRVAHRFRAGDVVFHEGEKPQGLYVVCTGRVKIYKSSRTGQQLVTRMESPGDLLGHRSMLSGENYSGSSEAMEESVVSMVDETTFNNFLLKHPKASLRLLRELSKDVRRGEDKARDIAFKPARGRLANVILNVMRRTDGKMKVSGLKRKDLAEMSALTIETTVRLLQDFEKRGILKRREKDLVVLQEEPLHTMAERFS
ncbi:MAG: Crp/Fnr family transcriptional regulator [Elusimicrobia bacterium]|nr:Crp/Fnr family transcriptional regulator [Elusimicrobiota bacterium]